MPEQLIAAAHAEHDRAARGGRVQAVALVREQVLGAQALVAVLAAADVEEVGASGSSGSPRPLAGQLEADAAPLAAALEHEQVAAVGVDVHQVRVQRAHAQRRRASGTSITTSLPTCSAVGGDRARRPRAQPGAARLALELARR